MARKRVNDGREPTITERARKAQIIEVTRAVVAEHGYSGASLAGIAEAAGVTKAAVLYYFPSKAAIVEAAYADTLNALVADTAAALESAEPADRPAAYVRTMVGHLREHPGSVRMITEAMQSGDADHEREERWGPLAAIIEEAAAVHGTLDVGARDLAVIVGGGIDGIVIEQLEDPAYDSSAAAERLVTMLESMIAR